MTVWILMELFEGSPRAVVFGKKKEAINYSKERNLINNPKARYGYGLEDGEYNLYKSNYFMENEC